MGDQLSILENELSKDGYLSPGDYDFLIANARKIQTSGVLKPSQISDYDVKISKYEKGKAMIEVDNASDLDKLQADMKSESVNNVMYNGNSPMDFVAMKKASIKDKLDILLGQMQKREMAGQDYSAYLNEYQELIQGYNQALSSEAAATSFDGTNPVVGMAAYVETNSQGDIVDIDYAPNDGRSGYSETDAVVGGFSVFGKTMKQDGKNLFRLGNKTFTSVDKLEQDPSNPGSFFLKPSKLTSRVSNNMLGSTGETGYDVIDPGALQVQTYIPRGGYGRSIDGTLYQRKDDGSFAKYINLMSTEKFDVGSIINIPREFEQNYIIPTCKETVDFSEQMRPASQDAASIGPVGGQFTNEGLFGGSDVMSKLNTPAGQKMSSLDNPTPSATKQGNSSPFAGGGGSSPFAQKTSKQPQQQASSDFMSTAKRTISSSIDYVKSLF